MSRVGKRAVVIPSGMSVALNENILSISKGSVSENYLVPNCLSTELSNTEILFKPLNKHYRTKSIWGTTQRNVTNIINGLDKNFSVTLKLSGVGYKAVLKGDTLVLQLGFSHDINYKIPDEVSITCPDATTVVINGKSKDVIGNVAAKLRRYRKPEPYKGKGIIKQGEFVYRKEGKKK